MAYDGIEKRVHPRIERPLVVRFRVRAQGERPVVSRGWDIVTAKNVSAGGLLFFYPRKISTFHTIEFKITLPAMAVPVLCAGQPVRVRAVGPSLYAIGVCFTSFDESGRGSIDRLVSQFSSRSS